MELIRSCSTPEELAELLEIDVDMESERAKRVRIEIEKALEGL